ncbi:methyl-accepting chemotaxis protein [Aestuariirhabdus sp. Z084]|uniref:methyl-accepting chemotaxis protein n=1 Tax=Aestuariirhabdus haliotis TaxID=2918751 RepID=UPI00201B364C|nr:methyl-accepting chemotaxis protein [Aestuariirhabdus haliotis]MCL6416643.1 methyl-accepting chemotaxis protein [Aestuariirhabdus haliotis]MCL6420678.1 methyl-accepting chemotaxis protein [Aestuariirhabdus haliotis]
MLINILSGFSIRKKLVVSMILAVVVSTSVVSYVGYAKAQSIMLNRLEQSDLPNLLQRVRNAVDGEIAEMKVLTQSIATNPFFLDWVKSGESAAGEEKLTQFLRMTRDNNQLSNASFVDKESAKYWNQDGLLRVLQNDDRDGWFYAFKNSGEAELASTYSYGDGNTDVFVNFQMLNGRGMSGVSKSFNDMVAYLNSFQIEKTGFVYLVDQNGLIKIHPDESKSEKVNISEQYPEIKTAGLFKKAPFDFETGHKLVVATSYIPSLGWYVVAEVPKAELYAGLEEARNSMLLSFSLVVGLFILISVMLSGMLMKPINALASLFKELGEGEGDLTYRLNVEGNNEIAQLSKGFNTFISKINTVVSDVAATSVTVRESSNELAVMAEDSKESAFTQRDQAIQVSTAINQMGSTIAEIAKNANVAAETTTNATTKAGEARRVVDESADSIGAMATNMETVSQTIESLNEKNNAISSVLDVIRGISDQTNLLALNAAIEAARAGESGRGFAVVADEVRNLAKRTADSTEEINEMITQLQDESKKAVVGVRETSELAEAGVQAAEKANVALGEIVEQVAIISDINTQVATATEEQSVVVGEINGHVTSIGELTEGAANTAQHMAASSDALNSMAGRLDELVRRFKL